MTVCGITATVLVGYPSSSSIRHTAMPSRKRQSNDTKRRIAREGETAPEVLARLSNARYVGSGLHKRNSADYGFTVSPRPKKSLCDDIRVIRKSEAEELFQAAIACGMVSSYLINGLPKYVWAVDQQGEVYESKISGCTRDYHGYRLSEERDYDMKILVAREWKSRNQA